MVEVLVLAFALVPLCDFIGRSTLLELGQGFGPVTPDPFSLREQGAVVHLGGRGTRPPLLPSKKILYSLQSP